MPQKPQQKHDLSDLGGTPVDLSDLGGKPSPFDLFDLGGTATTMGAAPMGYFELGQRLAVPTLPKPSAQEWRLFAHKASQDVAGALPGLAGMAATMALKSPAAGIAAAGGTEGLLDVVREAAPGTAPWIGAGPKTSAEAAKRSGEQTVMQAGQEVLGPLMRGTGRFFVPVRTEGAEAARALTPPLDLVPGQEVKRGLARLGLEMTHGSPAAQDYFATQAGQVIERFNEIAEKIGLSKAQVDAQADPLYAEIDRMTRPRAYTPIQINPGGAGMKPYISPTTVPGQGLTNPAPVNIRGTKRLVLRMFDALNEVVNKKQMIPGYDASQGADLLRKIEQSNWRITFPEAQKLRSLALMLQRDKTDVFPGETKAITRALVGDQTQGGGITSAMKRAAKLYDRAHPGSGLFNKWETAQEVWRKGVQRQNFVDFVDKSVRAPAQGESGDLTAGALAGPERLSEGGFVDARNLYSRYQKLTPAEKDLTIPKNLQPHFEQLMRAAMQTDRPGGVPAGGSATARLMAYMGSPFFDAMASKTGRALLTRGWRVAAGTPAAAALMTRLVTGHYLTQGDFVPPVPQPTSISPQSGQ